MNTVSGLVCKEKGLYVYEGVVHTYYMDMALKKAEEAAACGEVPIGALLVIGDQIYSQKGNLRESNLDPTAHAEILALKHASETVQNWRLLDSALYVTVEPCLMCTGAIYLARVKQVIYGCKNPKGGALDFVSKNEDLFKLNHTVEVIPSVRELECARLLKVFFKTLRQDPDPKTP